ncbi:hypothetical protein Tco_0478842 [Tanacetum coccineum]
MSTNHSTRSLPVSKSSCVMIMVVPKADHSKSSSSFSDSKHFVCSTSHKCVFNANHDDCITKLLKEMNSRAKIQSHKIGNNNKPVDQKNHTQKPGTSINVQKEQSLDLSAELESLFDHLFDEYSNGENQVVLKSSAITTADASNKRQQQPDSTSSTSTLATTVIADGNFDMNENKGRMPTKIELTLEQSQQGVSDDVLVSIEGVEE